MMKKIALYLLLIFNVQSIVIAQKIETDKIDDFTNERIIETSWVEVSGIMYGLKKIDDVLFLGNIFDSNKVYSMNEGQKLMFKLETGEIIEFVNKKFTISEQREYFPGMLFSFRFKNYYEINSDQLNKLKSLSIAKIRWNTSDGDVETIVKKSQSQKLVKLFNLLNI